MSGPHDLVGQRIEQYTIRKHIARGGMADVYLAYEEELQRKVAMKIMLPALVADEQYVIRFQREAQTVAKLDHANIVHVYAIGLTADGRPYIAMQYVEGGSLRDTLSRVSQQGRLIETTQALSIVGKMADALQVAHAAGIVHRDIKPSNILIRPDGRPVLVDLGIATVQGGAKITHTGTLIGTPHYMSPEQASGKPVDARSDLYSLGVILYEMLAGRRPFEAREPIAVLHQHVYKQPPPLENFRSDLSPETIYLVHRCLRKDPDERIQTAAATRNAINHVIKAEGGTGVLTQVDGWQPYPTEDYRLSQSQIMTPPAETQPPSEESGGRKWLLGLVPLVVLMCLVLTWLMIFNPSSPIYLFSSPTETVVSVARSGSVVEFAAETPSSTPELSSPVGEVPPTDETPVVVGNGSGGVDEDTAVVPTDTSTPPPTITVESTETVTASPTATVDLSPLRFEIGNSVRGVPIESVSFGSGSNAVIFIGGLHAGSAPSTVSLADMAITYFTDNPNVIPPTITLYIIPNANPDSPHAPGDLRGRMNANNVDLNRNWDCEWEEDARFRGNVVPGSGGPAPFSETETQALRDFVVQINPAAAVFWEAKAVDGMSSPGACGPRPLVSQRPAEIYGNAAGYEVYDFEARTGQILNGDGTNWIDQQGIPAIAVLLRDYENVDWNNNLSGMRAILDYYAN